MKKIIVAVAIVTVGIGGVGYALLSNKGEPRPASSVSSQNPGQQSQSETSKIETVTVIYDDNGFSPQSVEIAKGSTVNFVNKSSMPIWVASDPHPEHTDYPEFDTPRVLGRMPQMGEDFSFTFDKVGTWKYHSHTASGDGTEVGVHPGVIIVK